MECLDYENDIGLIVKKMYEETDGKLCFSLNKKGKVWKDFMKKIMNEEMIEIIMWKMQWKTQ